MGPNESYSRRTTSSSVALGAADTTFINPLVARTKPRAFLCSYTPHTRILSCFRQTHGLKVPRQLDFESAYAEFCARAQRDDCCVALAQKMGACGGRVRETRVEKESAYAPVDATRTASHLQHHANKSSHDTRPVESALRSISANSWEKRDVARTPW